MGERLDAGPRGLCIALELAELLGRKSGFFGTMGSIVSTHPVPWSRRGCGIARRASKLRAAEGEEAERDDEGLQGEAILPTLRALTKAASRSKSRRPVRSRQKADLGDPGARRLRCARSPRARSRWCASTGRGGAGIRWIRGFLRWTRGMPAALSSSLSEIRDQRLSLGAPAWRNQRLAIGKAGSCGSKKGSTCRCGPAWLRKRRLGRSRGRARRSSCRVVRS